MGFGAARSAPKATLLVGVLGQAAGVATAEDADILIADGSAKAPAAADVEKLKSDQRVTGVLASVDAEGAKALAAAIDRGGLGACPVQKR